MKIDVEDVFECANEMARLNRPKLEDIEFYSDGKKVEIPKNILDEWKFVGLTNEAFIMDYEWPE